MLTRDEALEEYIRGHIDAEPAELYALYRHTHLHHLYPRMCSGHYQGRLLKMLTAMVAPRRVLEIGTYTGYATLSMAEALAPDAVIDTVEIDDEKRAELEARFATAPGRCAINLFVGDAETVVPTLSGPYDLVFIDANKRRYRQYLEAVYGLLRPGGFVLVDNTLWDMKILGDGEGRDAQTRAIAGFNDAVAADVRFSKVILPVRDGLTILRKL